MYEICSEPDGNVSWDKDIKPYAERIIKNIRKRSPDSIILVGSGGVFAAESEQWLKFMNDRGISRANRSLCNKNETSAALKPGTSPYSTWTEDNLTASGRLVFSHFND